MTPFFIRNCKLRNLGRFGEKIKKLLRNWSGPIINSDLNNFLGDFEAEILAQFWKKILINV